MNDNDLKYLISGKGFIKLNDHNGYQWCPRCKEKLVIAEIEDTIRPHCKSCGFVFYQNPTPAAGAVIVQDKKLLLVRRSIQPGLGDWCIPAGFVEWTEHPQQAAIRELKEETGLDISITSIYDIFMGMDDPRTHAVLILYHADVIGGKLIPGDDADDAQYFAFDSIPGNIAFQAHRDAIALYCKRGLNK
ncbi:MAG: NUDIX hydrolase [candidate division Zixibacteria bacterium]|nr:NUDIX hydrolase [candidate division Zixibacteria bacterium]